MTKAMEEFMAVLTWEPNNDKDGEDQLDLFGSDGGGADGIHTPTCREKQGVGNRVERVEETHRKTKPRDPGATT